VIVVLADDQGSVDAGCYGATDLVTPALDRLADDGIRFTQFYSAAPVCSPSRAGLLTGCYPWTVGVPTNAGSPPPEGFDRLADLDAAGTGSAESRLEDSAETMAEVFRRAGYATAQIGKWHLGYARGSRPLDQGFDHAFGHLGGCIDNYSHTFYWNGPNRHDLWRNQVRVRLPGRFFPDLMVDEAETFLRANRDRPFFLYYALNTPHYPYQGEASWLERLSELPYPRNLYAAFLATQDERLGRLLELIDELVLTGRTIVVYQSDNGHSTEERAHWGGGSSGPYRGAKFSLFEGGIRLPAVISWPGALPRGQVRSQVAHACDWLPTLAELCAVPLSDAPLAGKSLVELLKSDTVPSPHDTLFWRSGAQSAVRDGPWKLIRNPQPDHSAALPEEDRAWFLADLDRDPGERHNRIVEQPEVFERLKRELDRAGVITP
jgi:arylsulfatase A-like enzyme